MYPGAFAPLSFVLMSDTLRDYLNQIGKIPLLTVEEEIHLGRSVQALMRLL